MTTQGAAASRVQVTLRLSVAGPTARHDLVVPRWAELTDVAAAYAEAAGLAEPPVLVSASGASFAAGQSVEALGLGNGDVLVVRDLAARARVEPALGSTAARAELPLVAREVMLCLAAVSAAGSAALAASLPGSALTRTALAIGLAMCALATAVPVPGRWAQTARLRSAASPAFAASAGFLAAYAPGTGGLLLATSVAGLAAVVVAALSRTTLSDEEDDLADVALVVGGVTALVATSLLLAGSSLGALLVVAYAAAVAAARLLPYAVVDVPDEALIDLDRLAVTAWSAREQPRGSRRKRAQVRTEGVAAVVRRGQRLVLTGTVVVAVVVAVGAPVLVTRDLTGATRVATLVMVALGGVALALVARSFRSRVPRLTLRLAALWAVGVVGAAYLRQGSGGSAWVVFAITSLLAALTVLAAVSLGRGWRSVWWGRLADIAEALSVVTVIAAAPVASGLFTVVRALTS